MGSDTRHVTKPKGHTPAAASTGDGVGSGTAQVGQVFLMPLSWNPILDTTLKSNHKGLGGDGDVNSLLPLMT